MRKISKKESPLELANLILKHKPDASVEMMADVISEWGDLFDDQKFSAHESIDIDSAESKAKE
jgi:hypothetical protein